MPDLPADLAHLVDRAAIRAAEAARDAAAARLAKARAAVAEAEAAVTRARAVLPRLLDDAVAGRLVTPAAVAKADQGAGDAEAWAAFTATVANRIAPSVDAAEVELKRTTAEAYRPVLEAGIDRRIAAAERADRAREGGRDEVEMRVAQADFEAATAIVNLARWHGAPSPAANPSDVVTTAARERLQWRRA